MCSYFIEITKKQGMQKALATKKYTCNLTVVHIEHTTQSLYSPTVNDDDFLPYLCSSELLSPLPGDAPCSASSPAEPPKGGTRDNDNDDDEDVLPPPPPPPLGEGVPKLSNSCGVRNRPNSGDAGRSCGAAEGMADGVSAVAAMVAAEAAAAAPTPTPADDVTTPPGREPNREDASLTLPPLAVDAGKPGKVVVEVLMAPTPAPAPVAVADTVETAAGADVPGMELAEERRRGGGGGPSPHPPPPLDDVSLRESPPAVVGTAAAAAAEAAATAPAPA